jgi:hypothetical protein
MHSCPVCGQACYCSGDCEDHDTGDEFDGICTCCAGKDTEDDMDDDEHVIVLPEPNAARRSLYLTAPHALP